MKFKILINPIIYLKLCVTTKMQKQRSHIPSLSKSVVNLDFYKEEAQENIIKIMHVAGGLNIKNKTIIFDPSLTASINLMIPMSKLREFGAIEFGILNENNIVTTCDHIIYIIRPKINTCNIVTSQIVKNLKNHKLKIKKYHIVFLPKKNINCERVFERADVWSYINIMELPINLIPIDYDLLSMEYDKTFVDTSLYKLNTPLLNVVDSLIDLQEKFGIIPFIQGIGVQSQFIIEEMLYCRFEKDKKEKEILSAQDENVQMIMKKEKDFVCVTPQIGRMIIIDRECDMISLMLNPLTYSSLIDEMFGIHDGSTNIPISENNQTKQVIINTDDVVFESLNYLSINNANNICKTYLTNVKITTEKLENTKSESSKLISIAKNELSILKKLAFNDPQAIKLATDNLGNLQKESITSIKDVVNELSQLEKQFPNKLLMTHFDIVQKIITLLNKPNYTEFIDMGQNLLIGSDKKKCEKWILSKMETLPITIFLRIVCLYSNVNSGIDTKFKNTLQSLIIKNYGAKYCFMLENLFNSGILCDYNSQNKDLWESIKRTFHLIAPDFNESDPNDISYIYGGYAPLSCRTIENALMVSMKSYFKVKSQNTLYKGWLNTDINKKYKK